MLLYEVKVEYLRQTGEDNPGKVKETYLLEGLNCADVENRLLEKIKHQISGDYEVPVCKKTQYHEIFSSSEGDWWYKARVAMITVEDNGKEKRKTVSVLIQATDILAALKELKTKLSNQDCEIMSIAKSPILEFYRI